MDPHQWIDYAMPVATLFVIAGAFAWLSRKPKPKP